MAGAGPVSTAAGATEPRAGESADGSSELPLAPPASGNKTIDLLLQLQPTPAAASAPALEQTTRALPPPSSPRSQPPAPDPTVLDQLKEAMLKTGVREALPSRAPDPEREARMAQEHQRREIEYGATRRADDGAWRRAPEAATGSLLDLAVVRYIRENRWLVIGGSLGVLALAYGAANFSFRRRSRR